MLHSALSRISLMVISRSLVSVILLAGGRGLRMHTHTPKQFLLLREKPLALHSFETLCTCPLIEEIVIVCEPNYFSLFTAPSHITLKWAPPGELRQDSVFNALQCISKDAELLCVHDSARPLLSQEDLLRVIKAAFTHKAAVLAAPVKNTIKESDGNAFVKQTLERSKLWEVYTPQVMIPALLTQGYAIAHARGIKATDDMSLVELTGHPVKLVYGLSASLKITFPEDLAIAEQLFEHPSCI